MIQDKVKNKLKILIAEDDKTSALHLTYVLEDYTKEILYAHTGYDTIEKCRNNPDIDLILMDIKMPYMDGLVATHKIHEFNKNVVIIAQTAYALVGDKEKALEAGCDDYITKPIDVNELMNLIEKYF